MTRTAAALIGALLTSTLVLTGCLPSAPAGDEQKDPHYLNGRARVSSLDYKGAMEEFEKAIEVNPRSSSAHLEMALLYEDQLLDWAAAIYHYEKHLRLRPDSEYAERAKERIRACKTELAKTEMLGPVTVGMQKELDRLVNENAILLQKTRALEAQLAQQTAEAARAASLAQFHAGQSRTTMITHSQNARSSPEQQTARQVANRTTTSGAANPQVHVVKSGDKLTTIASQYGVSLSRLQQANPNVDARRLKIGQSIKIP